MIDFHSHILPGIDDGSKSVEMSPEMLRMEQKMGIDTVVLTPHFYSDQNSPERFLARRQRHWEELAPALEDGMPRILLGAEVQYFEAIGNVDLLPELRIQGTNILLLEMPFCRWDDRIIRTVLELQDTDRMQILLAHIDRYLKFQKDDVWEEFRRYGVMMQVNCDFFDGFFSRRKAMKMLREEQFDVIGSDCHNLSSRKPNWNLVPKEARNAVEDFGYEILGL